MSINDENLVSLAQADPRAFGDIFDAYYSRILRYCIQRTGSVELAEDITSETFIKAYKNIGSFKWSGAKLSAWLYKIATNEIRMHFRARKNHYSSLDELRENGFEPLDSTDIQEEAIMAQSVIENRKGFLQAQKILLTLPTKYQEVIVLRYVQNKKISEIAVITGRKEGTVKSLLSRGLKKLQLQMQPNSKNGIICYEDLSKKSKGTPYEAQ